MGVRRLRRAASSGSQPFRDPRESAVLDVRGGDRQGGTAQGIFRQGTHQGRHGHGICVTENRVCVGGIRAIRRRKCFCKKSGSTSKGVEAARGPQQSEWGGGVHSRGVSREWAQSGARVLSSCMATETKTGEPPLQEGQGQDRGLPAFQERSSRWLPMEEEPSQRRQEG